MTAVSELPALTPSRDIPTTFTESFKSWWSSSEKSSAISEMRIFQRLPFFVSSTAPNYIPPTPTPSTPNVTATLGHVTLSTPQRYMNTLSIKPNNPSTHPQPATVLLPGYGAGIGFFYLNMDSLARWSARSGSDVYAVDWLGMGRSARVPFKIHSKKADIDGRVREAENFFIEALEEWRIKMGHEKMNLIGHSLGGYLSTAYALRYPERVSRLILLSPAGVPENPDDTTIPSKEVDPTPGGATGGAAITPTNEQIKKVHKDQAQEKQKESLTRRIATHLWEEGMSPFQILRGTMFYGPMLVGKYASRRFAHLSEDEVRDLNEYLWNISRAKGSGEYSISHLLGPTVHARRPLVHRVSALKMPVAFVYGKHDWMDPEGGKASIKAMRKAGNKNGRIYLVPSAGHHVYLDNPEAVDKLIVTELDRPID